MSMDYDSHKQHCVTVPRVKDNVEESLKRWRHALEKRGIKDGTSKMSAGSQLSWLFSISYTNSMLYIVRTTATVQHSVLQEIQHSTAS